ncbi:hypothetical protein PYW08_006180 [Mythimna loreyi]|uniref:Uncharacterized protein n=1 Tax=Mythimna loreyi TaxID=667449 RepID=A0ACC2QLZ8_9NEOP|nr:hypothetical protein PYW08_006180 [Mythimna loreyi]
MKLFWCCLLAALAAVSGAALDVEKTVKQVQNILETNQLLPRLTRDEIMQLLNDIRAEDAKSSTSASKESVENKTEKATTPYSTIENEINAQESKVKDRTIDGNKEVNVSSSAATKVETTTKKGEPTLMVVLPYTPRDGSSLQELYTRPPRTEVVALPSTTPNPKTPKSNQKTVKPSYELPDKLINNFSEELQAFLDAHGLEGKPGQDHFLLPLEGFKPLPPPKVIDGTVQLPENILLTYDLISPGSDTTTTAAAETTSTTTTTTTEEPKTNAASDSSASADDSGASIADLEDSFGGAAPAIPGDSELPPPRKNGFYWMLDWNSFLGVGDGDTKVNIRFEPKLGDPQMFLPVTVP